MASFSNLRSLKALNKYLWKYKKLLLLGFVFVVISNFFGIIPAQSVRHVLDAILAEIKAAKGQQIGLDVKHTIAVLAFKYSCIIIGMALLKGLFMYLMRQTIIVMSRHVEYDLKNDIFNHFQKLSVSYYRRNNTGDMMARISEDVNRVRMYIGPAIMYFINLLSTIILVVTIMLSVNPRLTMYVLMPLPILAIAMYYVNDITYKRGTYFQEQLSRMTTFVQESFSGIRVIKSFASEESVRTHFEDEVELYKNRALYLARVDALYFPAIALLIGLSTLITLYVGGDEVMAGKLSAGNIAEFFMYVIVLAWPVAAIGFTANLIQRAAASQARINEIMDIQPDIEWNKDLTPSLPIDRDRHSPHGEGSNSNAIELHDVSLTYPDTGIIALNDINISIREGESLGVLGHTGSGKSSLAYLLLRLYDTSSGEVLIDGKNIKDIDLGKYRKDVGYVPQDDFLFSESIEDNILWGTRDILRGTKDKGQGTNEMKKIVEHAATVSDVHKDIINFPKGYETMLGERGITLSGGQKQRVAIARAIAGSPRILILDDCFSAIDTNTEAQILQNLSAEMRGKTSVLISHRVSTVKNCTNIIVLQAGKIIEQGKHHELVDKKGYYYTLFRKQLVEKELYEQQRNAL